MLITSCLPDCKAVEVRCKVSTNMEQFRTLVVK